MFRLYPSKESRTGMERAYSILDLSVAHHGGLPSATSLKSLQFSSDGTLCNFGCFWQGSHRGYPEWCSRHLIHGPQRGIYFVKNSKLNRMRCPNSTTRGSRLTSLHNAVTA